MDWSGMIASAMTFGAKLLVLGGIVAFAGAVVYALETVTGRVRGNRRRQRT